MFKNILIVSIFCVFSMTAMRLNPVLYARENQTLLNSNLIAAAAIGNIKRVEEFLEQGADIHAGGREGYSALMLATMFGHMDTCRFLLKHGANVNQQRHPPGQGSTGGETALMINLYQMGDNKNKKREEICKLMLAHGYNATLQDYTGDTALTIASRRLSELTGKPMCRMMLTCESSRIKMPKVKALLLCLFKARNDVTQPIAIQAGSKLLYRQAEKLLKEHLQRVYCKPLDLLRMQDGAGKTAFCYWSVDWLNPDIAE